MILLHATRKLFEKLPLLYNEQLKNGQLAATPRSQWLFEQPMLDINPLSGWDGNLVTLQRRNCVLLVHNATRFPLVLPALLKPDYGELNDRFVDSFMNTLLKCAANEAQMNAAQLCLRPLQIDTQCQRSEQSTLTRIKTELEQSLLYTNDNISELTGYGLGAWLAHIPRTVKDKGMISPDKAMLTLLSGLAVTVAE
ncbi:DUF6933 domain-containing protein [Oceanisphaera sp. IT1-181]|uniref:DUF6933 domain-containing protein n=1 Tax=Oceanisphaera sp. IT1-181 TaxID=3081199 RepID=UPI0029C9ECEF|nr:hypothetical protein [Oceanisphaera sp. IT1-181]